MDGRIGYARIVPGSADSTPALREVGCRSIFTDAGEGYPNTGRGLIAAILSAEPGDRIVALSLANLCGSAPQYVTIVDELWSAGASLQLLAERGHTADPDSKMRLAIMAAQMEYRHDLSDSPGERRTCRSAFLAWQVELMAEKRFESILRKQVAATAKRLAKDATGQELHDRLLRHPRPSQRLIAGAAEMNDRVAATQRLLDVLRTNLEHARAQRLSYAHVMT